MGQTFFERYLNSASDTIARYDKLYEVIEHGLRRELTDQEKQYVLWLSDWNYETNEVFTSLFREVAKDKTSEVRWRRSDYTLTDENDLELLANKVTGEIAGCLCEGYICRNKKLCLTVAGLLTTFTSMWRWKVFADFDESRQIYRVWVEV